MNLDELYEAIYQLNLPKQNIDLTNIQDINRLLHELYKLNIGNPMLPGIIKELRELQKELRNL